MTKFRLEDAFKRVPEKFWEGKSGQNASVSVTDKALRFVTGLYLSDLHCISEWIPLYFN